ncbi:hypothetical protein V1511DRAFT_487898 [Dipodascopsis uninucleata]
MSHHDALGLLAICDAIDTVEAAASSSSSNSPSPTSLKAKRSSTATSFLSSSSSSSLASSTSSLSSASTAPSPVPSSIPSSSSASYSAIPLPSTLPSTHLHTNTLIHQPGAPANSHLLSQASLGPQQQQQHSQHQEHPQLHSHPGLSGSESYHPYLANQSGGYANGSAGAKGFVNHSDNSYSGSSGTRNSGSADANGTGNDNNIGFKNHDLSSSSRHQSHQSHPKSSYLHSHQYLKPEGSQPGQQSHGHYHSSASPSSQGVHGGQPSSSVSAASSSALSYNSQRQSSSSGPMDRTLSDSTDPALTGGAVNGTNGSDYESPSPSDGTGNQVPAIDPAFLAMDPTLSGTDSRSKDEMAAAVAVAAAAVAADPSAGMYSNLYRQPAPHPVPSQPRQQSHHSPPTGSKARPMALPITNQSSSHHTPSARPSSSSQIPPELRSEDCHICGRNFKGPKASTHKQQHIRRLHPDDYIPKRGGKKRALPLDPNSTAALSHRPAPPAPQHSTNHSTPPFHQYPQHSTLPSVTGVAASGTPSNGGIPGSANLANQRLPAMHNMPPMQDMNLSMHALANAAAPQEHAYEIPPAQPAPVRQVKKEVPVVAPVSTSPSSTSVESMRPSESNNYFLA